MTLGDDIADALTAVVIATFTVTVVLYLFGVISPGMSSRELIGKVAMLVVPASIGAMLARSQLKGGHREETGKPGKPPSYFGELFVMGVGAMFLCFNIAPTNEVVEIAFRIADWQKLVLAGTSILLLHLFVYEANFRGAETIGRPHGYFGTLVRFSVTGYAIAFIVSLAMLWLFGRTDSLDLADVIGASTVLGLPASVGAAAARLIL